MSQSVLRAQGKLISVLSHDTLRGLVSRLHYYYNTLGDTFVQ